MLNIGGDKNDRSYRYKMPPLECKVEGRGNGIKTAITNINKVALALHVIPEYPTKYFGIEVGAISNYDSKLERAIVNGKHETADLQKILDKFIDTFVLCPTCKLPELKMSVKRERIKIECAACGHNSNLKSGHKLTSFIINNPPPKSAAKGAHTDKNTEEERERKSKEVAAVQAEDVQWHCDTSETAQKSRRVEEFGAMSVDLEKLGKIDEVLAAAAIKKIENAPQTVLKVFLIQKDNKATPNEVFSELRRIQLARGLDDQSKITALIECFVDADDVKNLTQQFTAAQKYFKKAVTDKASAIMLINCLELFCGVSHPELLARFPLILKTLYDDDVLEDQHICEWYESSAENTWFVDSEVGNATRARSTVFVEWLQEDDEDDEDEE